MGSSILVLITVLVLILLLAVVWFKRKEIKRANYQSLFWLGVIFLAIYTLDSLSGPGDTSSIFLILGVVYFVVGILNKGNWDRQSKKLTKSQERQMIVVLALGVFLLALGVMVYSVGT